MMDQDTRPTPGHAIRFKRGEQGMSATNLAKRAKMPLSQLSQIENGRISPRIDTVGRLAKALKVPLQELWTEPEE